ncbi:MAG TPA: hypothetical protein VGJ14_12315, partial [Sporichthyaceae bacterium]
MSPALAAADDQLLHTAPAPLGGEEPDSRDPRFFERYWNVLHDDTGDLLLAVGGSFYPNLGRAESYAIANLHGDHRSVRAFRPLAHDRTDLAVGPLRPTIVEGLRRWRHVLEHGEWGFSYDLTVTDTHRHVYNAAWGPEVEHGERHVTAGFEGFCTVEGWVRHGDTLAEWGPGSAHGTRDRHWGVGRGVGGPAMNGGRAVRGGWKGGIWIDLGDVAVWGKQVLYPLDDPRPGSGRVVDVRRRLRFEPDTRVFTEGLVDLTMDDGRIRQLHLERLGDQTAYLRCGFYGGTPEAGLHHGEYSGPARVEWDRFDVTSATARLALRGLDEHHCRVIEDG